MSHDFDQKIQEKKDLIGNDAVVSESLANNSQLLLITIEKPQTHLSKHTRTISSWGQKKQDDLSRLKIGIVRFRQCWQHCCRNIARIDISDLVLIVFDTVEDKNLDRTLGVNKSQVGFAKVKAIAKSLRRSSSSKKSNIECV